MKTLFTLLFSAFFGLCMAQSPVSYINTAWSANNIDTIKNDIGALIGSNYSFTQKQIIDNAGVAYLAYANKDRNVTVTLQKGLSGGDADMGKAGIPIIRQVAIEGLFVDMFPVYQKLTKADLNMEEIKQKGFAHIPAIKDGGKTYMISFARANTNKPGYWQMVIKTI
jgi:hypothetical protein